MKARKNVMPNGFRIQYTADGMHSNWPAGIVKEAYHLAQRRVKGIDHVV